MLSIGAFCSFYFFWNAFDTTPRYRNFDGDSIFSSEVVELIKVVGRTACSDRLA